MITAEPIESINGHEWNCSIDANFVTLSLRDKNGKTVAECSLDRSNNTLGTPNSVPKGMRLSEDVIEMFVSLKNTIFPDASMDESELYDFELRLVDGRLVDISGMTADERYGESVELGGFRLHTATVPASVNEGIRDLNLDHEIGPCEEIHYPTYIVTNEDARVVCIAYFVYKTLFINCPCNNDDPARRAEFVEAANLVIKARLRDFVDVDQDTFVGDGYELKGNDPSTWTVFDAGI